VGETGRLKGPLWRPGDGFVAFLKADRVWLRDHPTSRLWSLVVIGLASWATESLVRSARGLGFWRWLGPTRS